MPSSANALAAFGSAILPPQTKASTGAYTTADARTLGAVDPFVAIASAPNNGNFVKVDRANPLHWVAVLYNPNIAITKTLAANTTGYPMTGVTMFLTYTCFATDAKRLGVADYIGTVNGNVLQDSVGGTLSVNTFGGKTATALGIVDQANLGILPTGWTNAINETFLKNSTQLGATGGTTLGSRNLWIQSAAPASTDDLPGGLHPVTGNPGCTAGKGA